MSTSTTPQTYPIPAERLSKLQVGVDKLNRRAAKLGMDPVGVVASAPRAEFASGRDADLPAELRKKRWIIDVLFTGTAPRIKGFTFAAKLDHQKGGNLVLRAPGITVDLDGWRVASPRCQHCGLARHRAQTFLLQTEKGELLQIGRQCLVDYIGTEDVANAVQWYKCLHDLVSEVTDEDGEYGFGGGWSNPDSPLDFIAAAVSSVRIRGFHKAGGREGSADYEPAQSTKQHCAFILGKRPLPGERTGDAAGREWDAAQPTEAQRATAATILAWVAESKDSSDFMHNARIACAALYVIERTEGILAALPICYDRFLGKEQERKARPVAGPHVGVVGNYIDTKVQVKYSSGYEVELKHAPVTVSGTFLIMTDENNSTIKARTTSRELQDVEDFSGDWYLRATVKKHETDAKRNNQAVTVVTRIVMSRTPFPNVLKQPKKRNPKPISKGAPLYGYKTDDTPGCVGSVAILAHEWICPSGVDFSWSANAEGTRLHEKSCSTWLSRMKPPVMQQAVGQ